MSGQDDILVSVALCTYNGAWYLQEQLDSMASQTRLPDELVVCDDRSTDNTLKIIETFAAEARFPVRLYVNEKNLGSTKNFERVIGLCAGDVIVLSDQDDVWRPEKLTRIEEAFSASPTVEMVFSDAEVVDEHLRPLGYSLWQSVGFSRDEQERVARGRAFEVLLKRAVATGATMAFRARLKNMVLPIPDGWIHDGWIALLAAALSDVASIRDPLIQYRQHPNNQIGGVKRNLGEQLDRARRGDPGVHARADRFAEAYDRISKSIDAPYKREVLTELEAKIGHLRTRESLTEPSPLRLPKVLRELAGLRYHRYSNGLSSAAKDLFF